MTTSNRTPSSHAPGLSGEAGTLELLALADRCEGEKPSRLFDIEIYLALHPMKPTKLTKGQKYPPRGFGADALSLQMHDAPFYTTSLDAAVTLVPEGYDWLRKSPSAMTVYAIPADDKTWAKHIECAGKSAALALCAAALRARTAKAKEVPATRTSSDAVASTPTLEKVIQDYGNACRDIGARAPTLSFNDPEYKLLVEKCESTYRRVCEAVSRATGRTSPRCQNAYGMCDQTPECEIECATRKALSVDRP